MTFHRSGPYKEEWWVQKLETTASSSGSRKKKIYKRFSVTDPAILTTGCSFCNDGSLSSQLLFLRKSRSGYNSRDFPSTSGMLI